MKSVIEFRTSSGTRPSLTSETKFKSPFVGDCKHVKSPVVINLREEINENTSISFVSALKRAEELQQSFVIIYINCFGGSVYDTIEMINAMRACKIPIYTCVTGIAASAAFTIFGLGQRRFIAPIARLMVHDVSCDVEMLKGADVKCEAEEMDVLKNLLFCSISRNIGKPDDYFLNMLKQNHNSDCYLNALEAVKIGLATDIGIPRHELIVDVQHVLAFDSVEKEQVKNLISFDLKHLKRNSRKHKLRLRDDDNDSDNTNDDDEEEEDNESSKDKDQEHVEENKTVDKDKDEQSREASSSSFQKVTNKRRKKKNK